LAADKIEFILEKTNLIVKTQKTHASFSTTPSADFPSFPQSVQPKKTFPLNKLKEAILRTVFAASSDEMRPVLTGVKTTIKNGKISFIATDGYRLSIEQTAYPDKQEELETILPAASLLELVRAATDVKADEVGFSIIEGKNQVVFTLPNIQIYTRLIDGEFPNIEKIIPVGFKTKVIVDKEQFAAAVKTTSLFARGAANIVKINIEKDGVRLRAVTPQLGEEEDFVEANVSGEEIEIAFNFRFLLDLLSNFPDKELVLETSGPLAPGVFKPTSVPPGGSFLHLIMPVRVQG
jgi:DNA polymerase-3 subunit beta